MNLMLAGLWLVFGLGLLALPWLSPRGNPTRIDPSLGWVALLLSLYNLVRWWGIRAAARRRAWLEAADLRRPAPERRPEAPQAADPNFNFTEKPSP